MNGGRDGSMADRIRVSSADDAHAVLSLSCLRLVVPPSCMPPVPKFNKAVSDGHLGLEI